MLVNSFLDYLQYERNYSERTLVGYRIDLVQFEKFIKEVESGLEIHEVDADVVRQWEISLMEKGYTTTSVNRKLSSLRSYFKFLLRKGKVVIDPMKKIKGPKNKKPLPVFLKESEMNKLLDEVEYENGFIGSRDKLILELFYATGMRLSELVGLNDIDVDLMTSVVKVTGKRNKQRLIPFGVELKESIQNYIRLRAEALSTKSDAFFIKENGERICGKKVYNLVRKYLSKVVSLKKRSPHVLRHTFATAMLNNEAQLGAVKELLGHSSLSATEVYTHTTFEELKKVYKQAHPRA